MNELTFSHAPRSSELEKLIGSYHTIGEYGPVYQVLSLLDGNRAKIVLLETDEEVTYAIHDILQDPRPNA